MQRTCAHLLIGCMHLCVCRVTDSWVNGVRLLRSRHLLCLDVDDIRSRVLSWQQKLGEFRERNFKQVEQAACKEEANKRQKCN